MGSGRYIKYHKIYFVVYNIFNAIGLQPENKDAASVCKIERPLERQIKKLKNFSKKIIHKPLKMKE